MRDPGNVTEILGRMSAGDRRAFDDLFPLVYGELRSLAAKYMRRERQAATLQATALTHEAYLRLLGESIPALEDRAGFFAVAARAMRQILVEQARARGRQKRGGGWERVTLGPSLPAADRADLDILALEDALTKLAQEHPRRARVVELLYFGGLSAKEAAWVLEVTSRTVERDWQSARSWLLQEILGPPTETTTGPLADQSNYLILPEPIPSAIRRNIGAYRVLREIGRGGMGTVYEVEDRRDGHRVALKLLPPSLARVPGWRDALHREAQLLGAIDHPNVARIYTFEESDGAVFLTLELLSGGTLADHLVNGAVSMTESIRVGQDVASALVTMHGKEVIHGDLKPANISVSPTGPVKVLDFGLARFRGRGSGAGIPEWSAGRGWIAGTPGYMSPEQIRGAPTLPATDAWALGAILYECLVGRPAFTGISSTERNQAALHHEPDWAALEASCPSELATLTRHCLAKEAGKRLHLREIQSKLESLASSPAPRTLRTSQPSAGETRAIHRQLTANEKELFRRLSVFDGGWTLQSAAKICLEENESHQRLLDQSLIERDLSPRAVTEDVRFRFAATTRVIARKKLQRSGETKRVRKQYVSYFARLAREVAAKLSGSDQSRLMAVLDAERANLLDALDVSLRPHGPIVDGLDLLVALERYWTNKGLFEEGERYTKAFLRRKMAPTEAGIHALIAGGNWRLYATDFPRARKLYEKALRLAEQIGCRAATARALHNIGGVALQSGKFDEARLYFRRNLTMVEEDADLGAIGRVQSNLGIVAEREGDWDQAEDNYRQALEIFRGLDDRRMIAVLLANLGAVFLLRENNPDALPFFEESLELFRQLDDRWGVAATLGGYGIVLQSLGDLPRALGTLQESLTIFHQLGDQHGTWKLIAQIGLLFAGADQPRTAVRYLAAAATIRETFGTAYPESNREQIDSHIVTCRSALGASRFQSTWDDGASLSLEQAVTEASTVTVGTET